ncbi:MAG: dUTP diphosphatase [Candidatus Cloacimonetes bacterium]|jgi:dUTP pyrophosphatase|nr:dUTP diphosphatase [Candidatus Cloacimonadota bacterium]MDY0298198.1 dUTP diphosphatase [Candidatus Cloacimonadaceae bacterium]MCB5278337.1 dUTP diphosphatase [Candidatus Cloacimonadota bacterium]MCK9331805.1 dUTP diphosphatase [Candidatus Cloacimonadota bacterium]MDD2210812.1 dUTP diphosphatase [Candidatus Cloacimonadota bacterium]
MKLRFRKLHPHAIAPQRMSSGAAGYDLCARLDDPLYLLVGQRVAVPTGIAISLPSGYEAQIRPRSGLALKLGLGVLNSPGTIDSDYRGEIKVILINLSTEEVCINPEMRIAQMIISRIETPILEECERLDETERAAGGFGSSGA